MGGSYGKIFFFSKLYKKFNRIKICEPAFKKSVFRLFVKKNPYICLVLFHQSLSKETFLIWPYTAFLNFYGSSADLISTLSLNIIYFAVITSKFSSRGDEGIIYQSGKSPL